MSGEKNHIIYTAKDIEAYFTGKLSPEAMHAMENQSLDDAFLAEAMEGYETMQGQNLKPQLADLHKHFENLNAPARVVPISGNNRSKWWKAAAAVLLIGAGATLTIVLNNRKSDEPTQAVAKVEPTQNSSTTTPDTEKQPAPENPPVAANPNTNVSSSNSPAAPVNPSVASRTKVSTTGPEQIKQEQNAGNKLQQNKDENFVYTPPKTVVSEEKTNTQIATPNSQAINGAVENRVASPQVTNKNVAVNSSVFNSNTNINNQALSETFAKANNVDDRKKADQQANRADAPMRNFIAQVVGPDNTPLPFSNVSIKNENFGTYADVNGNFRLVSTDSLVNVEVRSVGYESRTITLRADGQNKIILAEDENTAKERALVVDNSGNVDNNRMIRRARVLNDSVMMNVEPADGWANYNAYIANNIDIPGVPVKKDLHGEVEISFKVHPNGTVTNITVSQSDCADCAELAKRLVEQGPQWKIKKGIRQSSGKIKVQF